ncbi:hypothetical protein SAMN05428962_5821 [Paenibacillus sp. BC26]|nr:hypothetical protein SAMN05428962_5821 [Paenibacillus sp. BC26]
MPNYYFKEIWSPLKLIGVRFYRDDDNYLWVKMWSKQRRRVGS